MQLYDATMAVSEAITRLADGALNTAEVEAAFAQLLVADPDETVHGAYRDDLKMALRLTRGRTEWPVGSMRREAPGLPFKKVTAWDQMVIALGNAAYRWAGRDITYTLTTLADDYRGLAESDALRTKR